MNCSKCKLTFCWACMRSYANHVGQCNLFDGSQDDNNNNPASVDTRFEFYNHRYRLMLDSMKFEKKMYGPRKCVKKLVEIKDHWMRTDFIKEAVDVLIQCRLALAYSYIFAYFMQQTNQLLIFEQNLENLRSATEGLSETLENKINPENIAEMKQKIVNSST
jgi:ariadne-1